MGAVEHDPKFEHEQEGDDTDEHWGCSYSMGTPYRSVSTSRLYSYASRCSYCTRLAVAPSEASFR